MCSDLLRACCLSASFELTYVSPTAHLSPSLPLFPRLIAHSKGPPSPAALGDPGVAPSLLTTFRSRSEPTHAKPLSCPLPAVPSMLCMDNTNASCPYSSSLMDAQSLSAPPRPFSVLLPLHLLPLPCALFAFQIHLMSQQRGRETPRAPHQCFHPEMGY